MGVRIERTAARRLCSTLVLVVAILLASCLPLLQNLTVRAQNGAQGLQVSPVIVDLNSEKGGSYTLKLAVTNVTPNVLDVSGEVNDFTAADETGNPKIVTDNSQAPGTYSIRSWVGPIPDMTLQPKQSRSVSVTVNVPANAEPGGHYGVIRFSGQPAEQTGGSVSLNASVGVLLLARVAGNITEKLELQAFYAEKNGKQTSVVANSPLTIVAKVKNTGNVHVKPIGAMTVKDMFGKTIGTYQFGSNTKNVLPDSVRRYDQVVDKRFMLGRYTAHIEAAYGTTGGVLTGTMSFWVIPYRTIFFAIVIIALLVLLLRRLIRRYNRHIIHRSNHNKHQSK